MELISDLAAPRMTFVFYQQFKTDDVFELDESFEHWKSMQTPSMCLLG